MKHLLFLMIVCLLGESAASQNIETEKLDDYLEALNHNDRFMGTISVSAGEIKKYTKSVGFASIESEKKATPASTYQIGSISKSFTAALVFQAIEKGKLSLSTPLSDFFPSLPNAKEITVDLLLSHRSGIHNFIDHPDFQKWYTKPKTKEELIEIIKTGGTDFAPASETRYSNSNYVILSYILETVYNKPYASILKQYITEPLQLTDTYLGAQDDRTCQSYRYFDKWRIESVTHPSVTMGAGAIISTTSDLNRFFHALFQGKIVSAQSLEIMKDTSLKYGRGLMRFPFHKKSGYGHTGGIDGFQSIAIYFPEDQIAYSFTSNASNYQVNNINITVLSAVYNMPFEVPPFQTVALKPVDLDKYVGIYASSQLPIKLHVTRLDNSLMAQGTGQPAFPLEAFAEHTFRFDQAGIVLIFDVTNHTMILKQGGGTFMMKRE